ncbi:MAG: sugar transferase [Actinomycetota bacterium]|nr:sugar transferase [Actinomycetota bacterium]
MELQDGLPTGGVPQLSPSTASTSESASVPAATERAGRVARRLPKILVVLADVVTVIIALTLAFVLLELVPGSGVPDYGLPQYAILGAIAAPVWISFFFHYRLYSTTHISSIAQEFGRIVHAAMASVVAMAFLGFMLKFFVSRAWLMLTLACGVVLVALERALVRETFRRLRRRGHMLRSVVIVGWNHEGRAISDMLTADPALGYRVVGVVDDGASEDEAAGDQPRVIGRVYDALDAVQRTGASTVIVATTGMDFQAVNTLVRQLTEAGIHVELSSSLRDIAAKRLTVRSLGRFPVAYVEPVQLKGWPATAKRAFDLSLAAIALVLLSPLFIAIALAIKLTAPREPVLFKQERLGKDNTTFKMLKFRTMRTEPQAAPPQVDRNHPRWPLYKDPGDKRITPIGRHLRRLSLDELPQLWNVLRGEMSLVGPRPALPAEAEFWTSDLRQRLVVKPGITGMWQVSGRADSSFEDYRRLDLFYVDNWSLWTDLAILVKTLPALLSRRGAY